jgi:hypothetical protein
MSKCCVAFREGKRESMAEAEERIALQLGLAESAIEARPCRCGEGVVVTHECAVVGLQVCSCGFS